MGRLTVTPKFILFCLVLLSATAIAQPKDTLYFLNNSRVVGELKSIRLGRAQYDADGIGIVNIKNNKLSTIHAHSRNFRIEMVDGRVFDGYLLPSGNPGKTFVHFASGIEEVDIEDITLLNFYGQNWKSRLSGNVGAGFSYTKSSSVGRLNLNGLIKYNTVRSLTQLEADMILTYDSVTAERERESAKLGYTYSFPSLWTAGGFAMYQRNLELGLKHRYQQGIGIGRKIPIRANQQGLILAGVATNQESNLEGTQNKHAEVVLQINYSLFSFDDPNITLDIAQSGYVSISGTSRLRWDGDFNLNWEIIKDLMLSLQLYHNFDSKSPATGEPNIDFGVVAGLTYKF